MKSKLRRFTQCHEQKCNDAIKQAFSLASIDRIVTILDPLTGEEVKRSLHEVAGSRLARRTFIGNIYKRVKGPNLVVILSVHKERKAARPSTVTEKSTTK